MPKAVPTAAMRVQVSDSARLGDLERYLRSTDCTVVRRNASELEVAVEGLPGDAQARREVEVYLKAWEVMNPGARAQIVS